MADLSTDLCGLHLRNPILSASGTFGHGLEMAQLVPSEALGGWVSKTVTLTPRPGNSMPRTQETEAGFLNSIGLENRGLEAYIQHTLPQAHGTYALVITNIGGHTEEEFATAAARLDEYPEVQAIEVNLSCPNVDGGRLPYSTDPATAERVMAGVRAATSKPIFAKLSANVTRIEDIAVAAEAGGADGLTVINTLLGMGVDWRRGAPHLGTVVGGYSGTGIKPVALRCAWQVSQAVSIPVVGCGGISDAEDVLQFLAVGCTAVQVGTSSFSNPARLASLAQELSECLDAEGVATSAEVTGRLAQSLRGEAKKL